MRIRRITFFAAQAVLVVGINAPGFNQAIADEPMKTSSKASVLLKTAVDSRANNRVVPTDDFALGPIKNLDLNQEPSIKLELRDYQASYDILDGKRSQGTMYRSLKSDGNLWQINVSTKIKKWLFKYSFVETSSFEFHQGKITPLLYTADTVRSFKEPRRIRQEFDWQNQTEIGYENKRHWKEPLFDNVLDHLSFQIALRQLALRKAALPDSTDITLKSSDTDKTDDPDSINGIIPDNMFIVSYRGGYRNFTFEKQRQEEINTPIGKIRATLYTQKVANPKQDRYLKLWLAPDYDFIPIQFIRYKKGKKEATVRLKSFAWSDSH